MRTVSWLSRPPKPTELIATARAVVQRAPETLMVVRYRAQPTAATIIRQASTAILAYLLALQLPLTPRPVLAPLTALLVSQVTLYQTLRSAVRRVVAVVAGVLLAVVLSAFVGFTWWSLGLTIAVGLAVGYALHLGDTVLEVPISAMLILSVGTIRAAATGRVVETLFGAAAGLLAELVFARPRLQPAAEAVDELCRTMAGLLADMAAGLRDGTVVEKSSGWLGGHGRWAVRSAGWMTRYIRPRRASGSLRTGPSWPRSGPSCGPWWRLSSMRRSPSGSSPDRWLTAPAWPKTTARYATSTYASRLGTAVAELAAALRDLRPPGLEHDSPAAN